MAVGIVDAAADDLVQRLAALRAVVSEAIASKAPRRTVACLGAAVATALFAPAPPGSPSARAGARGELPVHARRRPRRGRRAGKSAEAAADVVAAQAACCSTRLNS